MGIRFRCHFCNKSLNVKDQLAGRRGKCPGCSGSFRIPTHDAELSIPLDEPARSSNSALPSSALPSSTTPSGEKPQGPQSKTESATESAGSTSTGEPSTAELPSSLIPWIDARWFVRPPSGGQYGPATTRMLADWIVERRVTPETFLWREGMETWQLATLVVPDVFGSPVPTSGMLLPPAVDELEPTLPDIAKEASKGSLAAAKAALATKRKRQRIRSRVILGLLITIAIVLVTTLFVVLWRR